MSDYCGCCGNEAKCTNFCDKCTKDHVLKHSANQHTYERTYFAQFGKDCPFTTECEPKEIPHDIAKVVNERVWEII